MILATTKVKDLDHFLEVFGTKGADKRGSHGSQGATVYRDPIEEDRVWAVFDWDEDGWTGFATDPETPGHHAGGRSPGPAVPRPVPRQLQRLTPARPQPRFVESPRCIFPATADPIRLCPHGAFPPQDRRRIGVPAVLRARDGAAGRRRDGTR